MSPHKRTMIGRLAAAAIPVGMAAAFAFQTSASAAPLAGGGLAVAVSHTSALTMPARYRRREPARLRAYRWALTQRGHPYVWGGTGPGYDCSGLVMMAYRHAGVHLPRTTYQMLASPLLVRTSHPRMGDLAFYGTGHVELFRRWGHTFGAHDYGSVVSLIHYGWGWKPTAFYHVRVPHRRRRK